MRKLLIIIPLILFWLAAHITTYGQTRQDITVYREDSKALSFTVPGNQTTRTLTFAVKAAFGTTDNILIQKSSGSGITATYSSTTSKTAIVVNIYPNDTRDLPATTYFYDLESASATDTNDVATLVRGNFTIQSDVYNRLSGTDLPSDAIRYIPLVATNFDNGEYIKKSGGTFVGDSLMAYFKKTDTTSTLATKYYLTQNYYTNAATNLLLGAKLDTSLATAVLRGQWSTAYSLSHSHSNKVKLDSLTASASILNGTTASFTTALKSNYDAAYSHTLLTNNPHSVTATQVGLGNVTNESKATMFTSPTFTGTVTIPTPFTLGAVSVTTTGTQLNYLNGANGTTGTNKVVFDTSPVLVTPTLGVATATSLAIGGATIGTNALAVTGTALFNNYIYAKNADGLGDPELNTGTGTRIVFNLSTTGNNAYGIGLGAIDGTKYPMWFQTGDGNGGGFEWYIGTSEKMRISKDGSLLVGYTSDPTSGNKFAVNGNSYFGGKTTILYTPTNEASLAIGNNTISRSSISIDAQDVASNATYIHWLSGSALKWMLKTASNTDGNEFSIGKSTGWTTSTPYFTLAYSTGNATFAGSVKFGTATFDNVGGQIYKHTTAGSLNIIGNIGTTYDFVLSNNGTDGQAVISVPTRTKNVEFGGTALHPNGSAASPSISFSGDTDTGIYLASSNTLGFAMNGSARAFLDVTAFYAPSLILDQSNQDVKLVRDAANTLALRNGTNAQTFNIYNTYTDASNYERLFIGAAGNIFYLASNKAGTGTARDLWIGTGSTSAIVLYSNNTGRWQIPSTGHLVPYASNTYDLGASGTTVRTGYFGTSVVIDATGASNLTLGSGAASADYGRINFHGNSATDGTTLGYMPFYNKQSGSAVVSAAIEVIKQVTGADNRAKIVLRTHNGTSLLDALTIKYDQSATFAGDISIASTKYFYLAGSESVDGSWRLSATANGNFVVEYRTGGSWTAKQTLTP